MKGNLHEGREKKIFEMDFVGKVEIARRRGTRRKTPLFEGMKATALLGGDALARSLARSLVVLRAHVRSLEGQGS